MTTSDTTTGYATTGYVAPSTGTGHYWPGTYYPTYPYYPYHPIAPRCSHCGRCPGCGHPTYPRPYTYPTYPYYTSPAITWNDATLTYDASTSPVVTGKATV